MAKKYLARAGMLVFLLSASGAAQAESLNNSLAAAYISNPTLKAQRATQRQLDEAVAQAKSGYRPTIQGTAQHSYKHVRTSPSYGSSVSYPRVYSLTVDQPIFHGFQTVNAVSGAEADVEAGREDLRTVEQQVLLEVVTAYMDVIRDLAIVRLQENNVRVLAKEVRATEDRFNVGEVTKTDVAQARARHAGAISELNLARANLKTSRAAYERVVGYPPSHLREPPSIARLLPRSLDEGLRIGEMRNPNILAALFREKSSTFAIKKAKGQLLPQVDLEASYTKAYDSGGFNQSDTTIVTGQVTVPIYQAGNVSAQIRQAEDLNLQRRQEIDQARQKVRSEIVSAWGTVIARRAAIVSDRVSVDANRIALSGVREEEKVGQRTVLDVLNAELSLLVAQVELERTRRDVVVASYALLAAIGRLSVADLNVPSELYDPDKHYRSVRDQAYGWHWTTSVLPVEGNVVEGGDNQLAPGASVDSAESPPPAENAQAPRDNGTTGGWGTSTYKP